MGDLVAFTEFGHGAFLQLVLKDKAKFLFHNTARFPWHALVLHAIAKVLQCQGCSRSILSGMCPVRTLEWGYPSLCGNWFVRPYIESRYFADHNMLGSATTKIRLPHRLVQIPFPATPF